MRRIAWMVLLAAGISAAVSCAILRRPDPRLYEGLDRRLDRFTFIEEGKLIALAVGTQVTRLRDAEAYIPLAVGFANKTAPPLRMTRESFILYDQAGKRYPMVPYSVVNEKYRRQITDSQFTTFFEIWVGKWPTYNLVDTGFFPVRSQRTVQNFVELPNFHYFMEYLYFPHPEGELLGQRFELHVTAEGLEDPVFVKFRVD